VGRAAPAALGRKPGEAERRHRERRIRWGDDGSRRGGIDRTEGARRTPPVRTRRRIRPRRTQADRRWHRTPSRLPLGPMRNRNGGIALSPVLVGAVTVLVIIVAVFLAYNANNGLPFVSTYDLKARVPNADALVKANEVRIGGARVGT